MIESTKRVSVVTVANIEISHPGTRLPAFGSASTSGRGAERVTATMECLEVAAAAYAERDAT